MATAIRADPIPAGGRRARRVLVTGGAGFVGSHVAEAHLARGDRVAVLDDLSRGRRENVPAAADFIRMDVADPATRDFIREGCFEIVNHHAAQIDVRVSVADPAADARTNLLGLLHVLEGARLGGTDRVVFVSSGGVVYGESAHSSTPEDAPKRPLSPYGVSKLASELYLDVYRRIHGLDCIALRYGNIYGPRQDPGGEAGVVAIFARRLLQGKPLMIHGDGGQLRDYLYVEDAARANLLAAEAPIPGGAGIDAHACNVGTGHGTSVTALADLMEEVAGRKTGRRHLAARPGEVQRNVLDPGRIRREWGWAPQLTLREGLAATFAHIAALHRSGRRAAEVSA